MKIQEKLNLETSVLYAELEKCIPELTRRYNENLPEHKQDSLSVFRAMCGDDFPLEPNKGIVFYGRANNGWNSENDLTTEWLYSQLHRPFFNLMRNISEHFYPENWNTHIVWSNICKVVPMSEGNPNDELWFAQYDYMVDILNKELEVLSPKIVVLVTGNYHYDSWDKPLFEIESDLKKHKLIDERWADNGRLKGQASLYKKNGRLYIITDRPERRKIKSHADCIIDLIEKNLD